MLLTDLSDRYLCIGLDAQPVLASEAPDPAGDPVFYVHLGRYLESARAKFGGQTEFTAKDIQIAGGLSYRQVREWCSLFGIAPVRTKRSEHIWDFGAAYAIGLAAAMRQMGIPLLIVKDAVALLWAPAETEAETV